jgi:four helix bundle protein
MHNFKELKVWTRSKDLAVKVYQITSGFPIEEKFGLTSQMRRCSVSVPSNIAEGCGRNTDKQLVQFLTMAMGSLAELETQLIVANELLFISKTDFEIVASEVNEIQKMLRSLILNKSKI